MTIGIIGRKAGMTRIFSEDGVSVPVTVIAVEPNRVTQVKTVENDGYRALQVTTGSRRPSRVTRPLAGHFAKAGAEALECFALPDRSWGAAVKIIDGSKRAIFPVTIELIYKLGARAKSDDIVKFHRPVLKNWRNIDVGRIEPGFEIKGVNHE